MFSCSHYKFHAISFKYGNMVDISFVSILRKLDALLFKSMNLSLIFIKFRKRISKEDNIWENVGIDVNLAYIGVKSLLEFWFIERMLENKHEAGRVECLKNDCIRVENYTFLDVVPKQNLFFDF